MIQGETTPSVSDGAWCCRWPQADAVGGAGGDEVSVNVGCLREGLTSSDLLFDEQGCKVASAEPAGPEVWGRTESSGLGIWAASRVLSHQAFNVWIRPCL